MPAIDSSTGLGDGLQIFTLQGHWLPTFHPLWVLFLMPRWTRLPASATDSQLSCSETSGHFWELNRKTEREQAYLAKPQISGVNALDTWAP